MKRLISGLLVAAGSFAAIAPAAGHAAAPDPHLLAVARGTAGVPMPHASSHDGLARSARVGTRAPGSAGLAASAPATACLTDTSESDFEAGTPTNVDLASSPGDAILDAPSTLDQQSATISSFGLDFAAAKWVAQAFTPGVSGTLAQVDVDLFCANCTGTTPDVLVSIKNVVGGKPSGSDLAAATLPGFASSAETYYSAVFSPAPHLDSTQHYAIVLRSLGNPSAGTYNLALNTLNPYAGGYAMQSTNSGATWTQFTADGGFKTYMHATFAASGTLASATKDAAPTVAGAPSWMTLSWNASTPANTSLVFQVAASDSSGGPFAFVGPDGTAATYYTTPGDSLLQFSGKRYLQYRAFLATSDNTVTPTLHDATVCYVDGMTADIAISNDDGTSAPAAGAAVVYDITVSNAGPGDAAGVAVTDVFPASLACTWTCDASGGGTCASAGVGDLDESVDLPAGTNVAFAATCATPPDSTSAFSNTATATYLGDGNAANNSATDMDTPVIQADVVVTVSDGRSKVLVGDVLAYQIDVTNTGPSSVSASVADVLPSQLTGGMWSCTPSGGASCSAGTGDTLGDVATLPAGTTATYVYSAMVQTEGDGLIVDMASADLTYGTDPAPANNSQTDTDAVVIFADSFE